MELGFHVNFYTGPVMTTAWVSRAEKVHWSAAVEEPEPPRRRRRALFQAALGAMGITWLEPAEAGSEPHE